MKQHICKLFLLCLLLLPGALRAQEIVGPDDPDNPSTGDKTITVVQTSDGSITPAGIQGVVTVHSGTGQTFTIRPSEGFEIASVLVDDAEEALEDADRASFSYTFTNIVKDHTLSATFRAIRFTLTATAGAGGSIIPVSAVVAKGGSQLFTLTPATGYEIADLKVDGVSAGAATSHLLTNVTKDSRLEASFKGIAHKVTLLAPDNGKLSVTADGKELSSGDKVAYGTTLVVASLPAEGYVADKLTVNGRLLTTPTCLVYGDQVIAATFKKAVYPVTVTAPENGTLTVKNGPATLLTGIHRIEHGTVLTLENRPRPNYTFNAYKVVPEAMLREETVTVTGAVSIGASFQAQNYPVAVTAPEAAEGVLTIDGKAAVTEEKEYPYGTVLTLGNTPAEGKAFNLYQVTPASALSGNRVTVTGNLQITIRFKTTPAGGGETDPEDGKKLYPVTYTSPLVVRKDETTIKSGEKVKEGTLLALVVPNTNSQRLTSLTANGNPLEYLTTGGLNTATYEVKSGVDFKAGFQANAFSVLLQPSEGGTLQAMAGGATVVSGSDYLYGSSITVTATPEKGYTLTRILVGGTNITASRRITLTEDLVLSVVFTKDNNLKPNPDPSDPDPDAPAGIDLNPQSVVYNRKVQAFEVLTMPGGVVDKVSVSYRQEGRNVRPQNVGLYDVILTRPADNRFAALNETIAGGLEIRKAAVTLSSIVYEEEQQVGTIARTTAILKGGKAICQEQEVKGTFAWVSPEAVAEKLTVSSTVYEEVRFSPEDATNYQPATARVRIQVVDGLPVQTYQITARAEGEGNVSFFTGDLSYPSSGPFYKDMTLSLKATAAEGYRFAGFQVEGVLYEANPYTFAVGKDLDLTARFIKKEDPAHPTDPSSPSALKVTLTLPTLVYNGKPRLASVSSVPALSGWQLEYRNKDGKAVIPVDAGTYQLTVSRAEDDTYLPYKETSAFTIQRATPTLTTQPSADALFAGAPLEDAALSGGAAEALEYGIVAGTFQWTDPRKTITVEGKETFRFVPADVANFYSVSGEAVVKVLAAPPVPLPIRITYGSPSGGSLTVKNESDGSVLPSGSLLPAGTRIRIEVKAYLYFKLGSLLVGTADYTVDAINGQGTVIRAMQSPTHITATFVRTSYPPDPEDPDPEDPDNPDNPDNPDPDDPDPIPEPRDYTVWVRKTGLGTVYPETSQVKQGDDLAFTITPGYSQQLVDVRLNGNSVGAVTEYRLRDIQGDATIEAVFSNPGIPVYTLSSRVVGKGGYVTPTLVRVAKGSNHQFVIHTVDKEMLLDVQIGTKEKMKSIGTPGSYIFRSVSADSILVASFGTQPTNMEDPGMEGESRLYAIGGCLYVQPLVAVAVLRVYSLSGQLVLQQRLAGTSVVQILPEGVYVAELKENNSAIRVKIKIAH